MLVSAAVAALLVGSVLVVVGALVAGSSAAYGALVGTLVTLGVLCLGSFVVNAVAGRMPAASLLVALLTYLLQIAVLALVFVALSEASIAGRLSREWIAGAVILNTMTWMFAQVWLATHLRIPAYELVDHEPGPAPAEGADGGER